MKKRILFLVLSLSIILAACVSKDDEQSKEQDTSKANAPSEVSESTNADNNNKETVTVTKESQPKEEVKSKNTIPQGENLLKEDIVFEYEDGDVVMTINHVEFTKEFSSSSGEDTRGINSDSEIYLHLTGTISNDTLNSFHYGHNLASVKFKAIYDNKHEFDFLATTESLNGSKLEGANIDSLQEQTIHIYSQMPLPVSERDNSLVLVVIDSEGEHEIVLR